MHSDSHTPKQALLLLTDGFEEIETVTPVDLLRRAGVRVTIASVTGADAHTGRCGMRLCADTSLAAVASDDFDMVILPGGPGVASLRADPSVISLVRRRHAAGASIAAICAAPTILADAGLLSGRRFTAHSSVRAELAPVVPEAAVVIDRELITARGAAAALEFGLRLVEALRGAAASAEIRTQIMA